METAYPLKRQQDASPSRIPHVQQQHDAVFTAAEMDARLAEKLSRTQEQVSPSRIPKIAPPPPPPAPDKALTPTARHKHHHHHNNHEQKQQSEQPLVSSRVSPPGRLAQQGRLPRLQPAHRQQQNRQAQQEPQDHLEPWESQVQQQQHPLRQQQQQQSKFPRLQQQAQRVPDRKQLQQSPGRQPIPKEASQHRCMQPHASAASNGWLASRKMHEFLLSQQRKKEVYWLSKYGRVLGPTAPASLGKPCPNPNSMFRHPAASHAAVNSSLSSSRSSSPLKLPLLPHNHSLASVAPENSEMSHRQQGYSHLPAATSDSSRSTPRGQIHYTVRDNQVAAPDSDRRHHAGTQLADGEVQQIELLEQQQEQQQQIEEAAFEQMKAKITLASVPRLSVTTHLSKSAAPPAPAAAALPAASASFSVLGPSTGGRGTSRRQLPCRDLEAELQVLKAIKGREDALDKLRACCTRLGGAVGADSAASMLLPSDPLGRLFYRLVANLRLKTLDVIEAHAAWQRKVSGPPEAFTYRGRPYLTHMGEGLLFLDAASWLAGRFIRCKAADDCLLVELTPDGVPIDDVTSFDMRRGPGHFSPEALRIRMARKVLAAAGVQPPADTSLSMAAALQQQQHQLQQSQELQQESSSSRLRQQALPHEQHAAALSAATAALGILQHFTEADTWQCIKSGFAGCDAGENDAEDSNDATSWHSQQQPVEEYLGQQQQCQPLDPVATAQLQQQQQQQQSRTEAQPLVQPVLQPLLHQQDQEQQSQQIYRHTDSCVIGELVDALLAEIEPAIPQVLQISQQQQCWNREDSTVQQLEWSAALLASQCDNLAIDEIVDALVGSLEGAYADAYPAFRFSCNDWVVDDILHGLVAEVASCC